MKHPGRWRALVLASVLLLIVAHVAHFRSTGRTLSPVEPSESMYALELGQVNAGLIFFALAIASTLLFGRFFCGWGCHVVALQDLCGALLRRMGLRPRPLRSRALLVMPAALAFYMFLWPTLRRVILGVGPKFPGFSNHLMTTDFWRTFPGPVFTVLTLVTCGFAAVWVLGSKGFCTYACPYGAIFSVADKFAPVRIVVDEGCQQTGQCTAACTSNVLVHEEVRLHAMVVDSGCMKCMDCVSVCPNGALSLGLARPAILAPKPAEKPSRWSPLDWSEEFVVIVASVFALLALRGLYDGPPLLMAAALAAITGQLALVGWHLARRPTVRLQSLTLKAGGEMSRSGWIVLPLIAGWLMFVAHSAFVQWHRFAGARALNAAIAPRDEVISGLFDLSAASPEVREAVARTEHHLKLADRFGLVGVTDIDLGLAWTALMNGRTEDAVARLRGATARERENAGIHDDLVALLATQGRLDEAIGAQRAKLRDVKAPTAEDHYRLGELLVAAGRLEDAASAFGDAVAKAPDNFASRHALGGSLRRLGRSAEAIPHLRAALALSPTDSDSAAELALAEAAAGAK